MAMVKYEGEVMFSRPMPGTRLTFFIGGPIDNGLAYLNSSLDMLVIIDEAGEFRYYPDPPLRTGVAVFSCLWGEPRF